MKDGMTCPVDGAALVMSERQGVEIDYCPQCRGVWLDRGELDKIIERAARDQAPATPAPAPYPPQQTPFGGQSYGHGQSYKHKRPKSFLQELFD